MLWEEKIELVGDGSSRTNVAIIFYSFNDLVCGRHSYPIHQGEGTGRPKSQSFIEQMGRRVNGSEHIYLTSYI